VTGFEGVSCLDPLSDKKTYGISSYQDSTVAVVSDSDSRL
jgi:hypothetical protein